MLGSLGPPVSAGLQKRGGTCVDVRKVFLGWCAAPSQPLLSLISSWSPLGSASVPRLHLDPDGYHLVSAWPQPGHILSTCLLFWLQWSSTWCSAMTKCFFLLLEGFGDMGCSPSILCQACYTTVPTAHLLRASPSFRNLQKTGCLSPGSYHFQDVCVMITRARFS